jgi:hypothetical protein
LKYVDEMDKAGVKPRRGGPPTASDAWRQAAGLRDSERGEGSQGKRDEPVGRTGESRPSRQSRQRKAFAERLLGDEGDEVFVDDDSVRSEASRAVERGGARDRSRGSTSRSASAARRKPPAGDRSSNAQSRAGGRQDRPRNRQAGDPDDLSRFVDKRQAGRLAQRLATASKAFDNERFGDAGRSL